MKKNVEMSSDSAESNKRATLYHCMVRRSASAFLDLMHSPKFVEQAYFADNKLIIFDHDLISAVCTRMEEETLLKTQNPLLWPLFGFLLKILEPLAQSKCPYSKRLICMT
jgi:hypothetical protein